MVANFSAVKDHALFVAAAKVLLRGRGDIHFLLVGEGRLQKSIQDLIRREGMRRNFSVTSTWDQAATLFEIMDVCVLTSQREGFPNALMEAMTLGKPVVAAAVGGIPELVEDGVSGLLVSTRDPRDFAAAVSRCIDDNALATALGRSGQERVRNKFSAERMVESYRELYAALVASRG